MSPDQQPAADNIRFLEQGIRLIRRLGDDLYTLTPEGPFRGGVGSQFRHCLDLYRCFLSGLDSGRVDYSRRERDPRVETDRGRAEEAARDVVRRLSALAASQAGARLGVNSELPAGGEEPCWSDSSVRRELQFLLSHTIHHYALISAMLAHHGFRFCGEFAGFGVAPSTLRHWEEETGSPPGS
jgi:hypothetical protein